MEKIRFMTEDRFDGLAALELAFLGQINTNKYVSEAEKLSAFKSCNISSRQCNKHNPENSYIIGNQPTR